MSNVVPYTPPVPAALPVMALLPANLGEGMRLADMMATSRLVPAHLQKSPADCLMVIQQAMRWGMDPFAVAQATSVIQGKLMYEGKLVAAVVNSLGKLSKRLSYAYAGQGDGRTVTVGGTLHGESDPLTVEVRLKDAKTNNKVWQTQPDQQLAYHGARVWARRYMPELMLGVYSPEEFEAPRPSLRRVEQEALAAPVSPDLPPKAEKPKIRIKLHDGGTAEFDRTGAGLHEAYEFLSAGCIDGHPEVVGLNNSFLDWVVERYPGMADDIAELRAAAAMAMAPKDEPEPDDLDAFGLPPVRQEVLPTDPPSAKQAWSED